MEMNQMLKRQEHFFQSQKTKKYEFRKKALLRLECAIKQHEEDIDRKSTRLNSSHKVQSRMPSSA